MKQAVCALIFKDGKVLSVSRKDNHEDKGLPGGKVDPEDVSKEAALRREVLEETGYVVTKCTSVFESVIKDYIVTTYLCEVIGEISTTEAGAVEYVDWATLTGKDASFAEYNRSLLEHLKLE